MMDRIRAVLQQLQAFWGALTLVRRIALVGTMAAVLVGVLVVATLGSRVEYGSLYSDLDTEDAAAVVKKLDALKVPYKVVGNAISVPAEQVPALRLQLAADGLPRGSGVGFEIFDRSQIGATEFEQNVNLRRALEGELSRSISTLEGVRSARVHLVLPKRGLFARKEDEASASVVIRPKPGAHLGAREVAGIVHLVTTAVPGLGRERVSVVSTDGKTLHKPARGEQDTEQETQLIAAERARVEEESLSNAVREQLERVVGAGNATVQVHLELDPTDRLRTEERYEPSKTALRSEQKTEETTATQGTGANTVAGVPGAMSNLPGGTAPGEGALAGGTAAGPGGQVLRRSHVRNWEVERITEKIKTPPGRTQRVSVAAMVNGKYVAKDGKSVFVPRSKEELADLDKLVRAAVGFNAERGDAVHLTSQEFARAEEEATAAVPELPRYVTYSVSGVAVLAAVIGLLLLLRRRRAAAVAATTAAAAEVELASATGEPAMLPAGAEASGLLKGNTAAHEPELEPADYRKLALEFASKDPATAAIVIKKWLAAATPAASAALPGAAISASPAPAEAAAR